MGGVALPTPRAGDQAGFPLGWVHDVVWAPTGPGTR